MKRLLPLILLLLTPLGLFADGMVIRPTAIATEVTMPDQRALIHFTNGVERLVIETRFSGAGTNFCWVVPLPSVPKIEAATTGLFPTLGFILKPKLIHRPIALFPMFTLAMIFIYLSVVVRRKETQSPSSLIVPTIVAVALAFYSVFAAAIAFVMIFWAFDRICGSQSSLIKTLATIFILFVLASMLMPTLGIRSSTSAAGITELQNEHVGAFDVTTVESKNPAVLLEWLKENNFEAPPGIAEVVKDYVKEGWVFSVAKLHRDDAGTATSAIHPLSFTFKTSKPIYPMRLTGLASKSLKVDLYVVGSQRASAQHFIVKQCALVVAEPSHDYRAWENELPLKHSLLKSWLHSGSVVTKLSANLGPTEMKEDVQIDWEPFQPTVSVLYSNRGASVTAADLATGIMLVASLAMIIFLSVRKSSRTMARIWALPLALGVGAFIICFLGLPKTPVHTSRMPRILSVNNLRSLGYDVLNAWDNSRPATLGEAQRIAAETAKRPPQRNKENLLLGGQIHEEDSPGNYVIRQGTNGFEFVWFAADGSEQTIR
ncbi:MAG TPA: DUF2330 domain-containing protein [Candidatus Paceibacterota bacterium]|nr:DUF2330 domain-containing protein [Candidatus Paceibacterota bacterium]